MSGLEKIGEDYYETLQELTFNSKPLITKLTITAQENIAASKFITAAIIKRITKCVPSQKLCSLYLLDLVCKNVGLPYTVLFSLKLPQIFINTYTLVDDQARRKMVELFRTWKTAKSTSGSSLFAPEGLEKIEKFLNKIRGTSNTQTPPPVRSPIPPGYAYPPGYPPPGPLGSLGPAGPPPPSIYNDPYHQAQQSMYQAPPPPIYQAPPPPPSSLPPPPPSVYSSYQGPYQSASSQAPQLYVSQPVATVLLNDSSEGPTNALLISDIDALKNIVDARLAANPSDTNSAQKLVILNQLRAVLLAKTLGHDELVVIQKQVRDILKSNQLKGSNTPPSGSAKNSPVIPKNSPIPTRISSPVRKPPSPPPAKISNLLQTLQSTGVMKNGLAMTVPTKPIQKPLVNVSKSFTIGIPKAASPSPPAPAPPKIPAPSVLQSIISKTKSGSKSQDFSSFELTNESIAQKAQQIQKYQRILFLRRPLRCNNCGKRFARKAQMHEHLDWHFRINKRMKDPSAISCRSPYISFDLFINFKESDILGTEEVATEEVKPVEEDQGPESHYIVIPSDSLDMSTVCNICKDTLKGVWDNEKGDWIWSNAVEFNGKVYHWTCYKETRGKRAAPIDGGIAKRPKTELKV